MQNISSNDSTFSSALTPEELRRYSRHLLLPEIGAEGQRRLKASSLLCIGAGGLGSPALLYLAAAGVGTIGIIDPDTVDETNLQRQIIHSSRALGQPKTESARATLEAINPGVEIRTYPFRLERSNARPLFAEYDLILDGTDNFPARYLINDAAFFTGKPCVHGAIYRFEGQVSVFDARRGPCYRCLFPHPPGPGEAPSCAEAGVLGVLPGVIGCLQATEALKLLLGVGEPLIDRLLLFEALAMRFRELRIQKRPECPLCGATPSITDLIDYEDFCGTARKEPSMQTTLPEITVQQLKERQDRGDDFLLLDVREPQEYAIAHIPGAILIPLGSLPSRVNELDPDADIVLQCRSGVRSAQALAYLQAQGFTRLANLRGGILAWAEEVDPSIPRY